MLMAGDHLQNTHYFLFIGERILYVGQAPLTRILRSARAPISWGSMKITTFSFSTFSCSLSGIFCTAAGQRDGIHRAGLHLP